MPASRGVPVLVVGATGMLGGKIARALLDTGRAEVRLLVRTEALSDSGKKNALVRLLDAGAVLVEGELGKRADIDRATGGAEVIVSAVQGDRDVIVDGQLALLEAAKRNGVRRMIPSDFAVDLFNVPYGRHPLLNMRREADEAIAASGIEHVHVLNGAFMDTMLTPFIGVFDLDGGTARFWGTGDEPVDLTTTDDTARYTAEAAIDRQLPSGKFAVAGEVTTFRQAASDVGMTLGKPLQPLSLGSLADLENWIAERQDAGRPLFDYLAPMYMWTMVSGAGKLTDLQNGRYPHIRPESLGAYAGRTIGAAPPV